MKRLYFIRHGLSEFNKAHVWAGSSDTPLAPEGHDQAIKAGKRALEDGLMFDAIISSPLERALQTAKHVADQIDFPQKDIIIDKMLIERDFGILEGRKDLVATTKYILRESAIDKYDGVETVADLQKRADRFLLKVRSMKYDNILVVGHGAFGRALRRSINQEPITHRGHVFANAEIVRFI